jgi:hypothetical protein
MSDLLTPYFTLDVVKHALFNEYKKTRDVNDKIWEQRGVCVRHLFKTTDTVERKRFEVELKRIECICEKTQEQCQMLFALCYPPVVVDNDDDSDDSNDYRLGDVC